jgi:hypothetical protein
MDGLVDVSADRQHLLTHLTDLCLRNRRKTKHPGFVPKLPS